MKKFLLSFFTITAFVAYSFYERTTNIQPTPIIAIKATPVDTPTPSSAPTNSPTPSPLITPNSVPTPQNTPIPTSTPSSGYKNGTYTGSVADAFYGNIQVQATIQNGQIMNVTFLQAPSDRSTSVFINNQADPMLAQEAIQAQSANVNIVSGATDSSQAFIQSLQYALDQAKS